MRKKPEVISELQWGDRHMESGGGQGREKRGILERGGKRWRQLLRGVKQGLRGHLCCDIISKKGDNGGLLGETGWIVNHGEDTKKPQGDLNMLREWANAWQAHCSMDICEDIHFCEKRKGLNIFKCL